MAPASARPRNGQSRQNSTPVLVDPGLCTVLAMVPTVWTRIDIDAASVFFAPGRCSKWSTGGGCNGSMATCPPRFVSWFCCLGCVDRQVLCCPYATVAHGIDVRGPCGALWGPVYWSTAGSGQLATRASLPGSGIWRHPGVHPRDGDDGSVRQQLLICQWAMSRGFFLRH